MKDVRLIFVGKGIMEKHSDEGVFKRVIEGARLESGPAMDSDELVRQANYSAFFTK